MKKSVAFGISGAALVYLLFAFTMWDANPRNWSLETRLWCAYFAACLCAIPALHSYFGEAA